MALGKLNKLVYIKVSRNALGMRNMSHSLSYSCTGHFFLKNDFFVCGLFSWVTFMIAHCLCQAPCLWFAEFCYLKSGIVLAHFQSVRNFPSYISFPKITNRSLLIPFENSLCSLSSNMLARRFENTKRAWVPLQSPNKCKSFILPWQVNSVLLSPSTCF